jgi:hypothetical protein
LRYLVPRFEFMATPDFNGVVRLNNLKTNKIVRPIACGKQRSTHEG